MNVYCYHRKFKKAATAAISSWENELKKISQKIHCIKVTKPKLYMYILID